MPCDCGVATRDFKDGWGNAEHYQYLAADSTVFKYTNPSTKGMMVVSRKRDLEGRANIYVAPAGEQTKLSTNVRYVLNSRETLQSLANGGAVYGSPVTQSYSHTFETAKPLHVDTADSTLDCSSKGVLEARIIKAAMP
jgi:hypothetical protein